VHAASLRPAALAFDAVADQFDSRFGPWLSVAAQRRAVRRALLDAFPIGAHVLEMGGGTGEDAGWLTERGRRVLLTDASPSMVRIAARKLAGTGSSAIAAPAEEMERIAEERTSAGEPLLDGAFSNFAGLNCVGDLAPVARGLARMLGPGAPVLLVLFGPLPPGEVVTEVLRGRPRSAVRRLARGDVAARLGGREFTVRYHRPGDVARALSPWFRSVRRLGVGVFVPPSAAEPRISSHPRLLGLLEMLDRAVERPLALLGDHVLYHWERTGAPAG
jgi:SAM-dependent methyltransferase